MKGNGAERPLGTGLLLGAGLLIFAQGAAAAPTCGSSAAAQDKILFSLCGEIGPNAAKARGLDCVIPTIEDDLHEAVIFTAAIERCGDKRFAEESYRGIALMNRARAKLALCVGVDLDVDKVIARFRSAETAAAFGRRCPTLSGDAANPVTREVSLYRRLATDDAFRQETIDSLYAEAGVAVDAAGDLIDR